MFFFLKYTDFELLVRLSFVDGYQVGRINFVEFFIHHQILSSCSYLVIDFSLNVVQR